MNKATKTLEAIKVALGIEKVELATMKLEDGVTVIEADVFEAGNSVMILTEDEQRIALPIGEYKLEDGMVLVVVEDGVIDSIGEAKEEAAEETEAEVVASDKPTETAVPKKVIEAVTKESHFSTDIPDVVLEAIAKVVDDRLEAFKTELSEVKEEEVQTIKHNPEVELSAAPKGLMAYLNNRK